MNELFYSPFFGIILTILAFGIGVKIQKKTEFVFCNPLLIAIILIIGFLQICNIPYDAYSEGGNIINMFLAPATACLAVSIYTKLDILKKYWIPILVGCICGSASSMGCVYFMCRIFKLDENITYALIPKSVTTPIALSIAQTHGGLLPITVVAVIITGILGSIMAPYLIKIFRVNNAIASGISIGACSHAVGTSKALELGETEGAMSGLAIGICGIITVIFSLFI